MAMLQGFFHLKSADNLTSLAIEALPEICEERTPIINFWNIFDEF